MLVHILIFLLAFQLGEGYQPINEEVLGLLTFKADLQDPLGWLQAWSEDDINPCNWTGITCGRSERVVELALDGFSLSGRIGKSLLSLQFLRVLSLSNNSFSGTISPSLAQLKTLRVFDVSYNYFSGSVPNHFFQQWGLIQDLSFSHNNFSGPIPLSLSSCSSLFRVNFSFNIHSGVFPSPVLSLGKLRYLDLSDNLFEGEIPRGIGSLLGLRAVNLKNNLFSGQVPSEIGTCSHLESLDLRDNYLSGKLPDSMKGLGGAQIISLRLGGNSFTGTLPDWIGEMRSLLTLDLSANAFSGKIPSSIGNLQMLKELNLSMNKISGSLPASLSNLSSLLVLDISNNVFTGIIALPASYQSLQVLDISGNKFFNRIPDTIGAFTSLILLKASNNFLYGSIPASIGGLRAIRVLDLSSNQLNGTIPPEICEAKSLEQLSLKNNFLSGNIPLQFEKCSSLTSLILSRNNLTGLIPAAIGRLSNLQTVDLSENRFSGILPQSVTNLSHLRIFNISYNFVEGALPNSGFFNTISPSSLLGNPSLCGSMGHRPCPAAALKPIVLNPNSSNSNRTTTPFSPHPKRIILSISALIAIGAAICIAIGVVVVTILNIHARNRTPVSPPPPPLSGSGIGDDFSCSPTADPNFGKLFMFSGDADFVTGAHALLNKDCELGRGGFGTVYHSTLKDGRSVAIKKLTVSIKSQEDFEREVKELGRIRHPNLVTLEGYYWTCTLQLLIYEYLSDGSLYKHLHDETSQTLPWRHRFSIVHGIAKGLHHLHRLNVIHYNVKSTNVLIDEETGEAKVGDFGVARLLPMLDHYVISSKIQSALGYMAPELACRTVKITDKCDVFGFGIVVLEVVTGRKPVEYLEDDVVVVCDWVRGCLEGGRVEECVDGRLGGEFAGEEAIPLIKLGLICASQVPSNRPDMGEVVTIMDLIQCPSDSQE